MSLIQKLQMAIRMVLILPTVVTISVRAQTRTVAECTSTRTAANTASISEPRNAESKQPSALPTGDTTPVAQSVPSQPEKFTLVTNPSPCSNFNTKVTELSERESNDPQISDATELALKLHNPIGDLVNVPIESDFEFASRSHALIFTLNVQPVIPFKLTKDWLLVTRTIVPLIEVIPAGDRNKIGLGDITQSFFLSPAKLVGGWTVGAGPVFQYPTATDSVLGAGKWGAGPTAAALRQDGGWTFGVLANHMWSFAGDRLREKVDTSLVDPFISYTWKNNFTVEFDGESTFDWQLKQWTVPLTAGVSRLLTLGKQSVSVGLDGRWYAERLVGSPKWGVVSTVTFVFTR